ncbi:MAG: tetratricopeptide repeat protein [Chromatiales bacterium]|nr:MAG: tetratricopeptide repeat protein [Chromatiales bacterium]
MRNFRALSLAVSLFFVSVAANSQEDTASDEEVSPLDQTVPVADEAVTDAPVAEEDALAPEPAKEAVTEEDALREFARFRQLLADRNFDEADVSAKRVVEMSIKVFGPQSRETAKALNNLAIVQHNNKQYSAAIQNFTSAIEILEAVYDRLNGELVNPLKGLGSAQLSSGRPDQAVRSYRRATHITHVNEGPHNIEQVEILEALAEANVRLGEVETARDTLDRIHAINVRHFSNDALGLLPSLMRRADWQHRAGYFNDERMTYRRAIRIIETASSKNDPRLVTPLIQLGRSYYYYEPITDGSSSRAGLAASGEPYFRRAVRIAEGAEDLPWLERAKAQLALADYYTGTETHNRARRMYAQIWEDLSLDDDRLEMRKELLQTPAPLREGVLPQYAGSASTGESDSQFLTGVIQVDYTVSNRGRVRNIRTEATPVEFTDMQRMAHREIRARVFRPVIEDGEPVESGNQVFRHEFYYTKGQLDDLQRKKAQAEKEKSR